MSLNHTRNPNPPEVAYVPMAGWHDATVTAATVSEFEAGTVDGVRLSFTFTATPSRRPEPGMEREWVLERLFQLPVEVDDFDRMLEAMDIDTVEEASDLVGVACRIQTVTLARHTSAAIREFAGAES